MNKSRRLPVPWDVIEQDEGFEVRDSAGISVTHVSYDDEPTLRRVMKRMTRDGAYRDAVDIAKLPILLGTK
jgi:hypothetical protein